MGNWKSPGAQKGPQTLGELERAATIALVHPIKSSISLALAVLPFVTNLIITAPGPPTQGKWGSCVVFRAVQSGKAVVRFKRTCEFPLRPGNATFFCYYRTSAAKQFAIIEQSENSDENFSYFYIAIDYVIYLNAVELGAPPGRFFGLGEST